MGNSPARITSESGLSEQDSEFLSEPSTFYDLLVVISLIRVEICIVVVRKRKERGSRIFPSLNLSWPPGKVVEIQVHKYLFVETASELQYTYNRTLITGVSGQ